MFKANRRGGTIELSEKSPLEMIARFLAAQAWSREIQRPPVPQENTQATVPNRARYALEVSEYMDRHWREYVGPAQLLVRTCLKRPNRAILSKVCAATGAPENVVIAVWDAGVEHTVSDTLIDPASSPAASPAASPVSSGGTPDGQP